MVERSKILIYNRYGSLKRSAVVTVILVLAFVIQLNSSFGASFTPGDLEIKITSPSEGDDVPHDIGVNGTITRAGHPSDLPEGEYLWLAVGPRGDGAWWPQTARISPWLGLWNQSHAYFGGDGDLGKYYNVAIITVNRTDDEYYRDYLAEGKRNNDTYPAIPLPYSAKVYDRIEVRRSLTWAPGISPLEEEPCVQAPISKGGIIGVRIKINLSQDVVPITVAEVNGTIDREGCPADLPDGEYMWLMVGPSGSNNWWPQKARIDPWKGRWAVSHVTFGGEGEVGLDYDVAAVTVSREDDGYLRGYLAGGAATGVWSPIPLPYSAKVYDKVAVKRG